MTRLLWPRTGRPVEGLRSVHHVRVHCHDCRYILNVYVRCKDPSTRKYVPPRIARVSTHVRTEVSNRSNEAGDVGERETVVAGKGRAPWMQVRGPTDRRRR